MPRELGTLKKELERLKEPKLKKWVSQIQTKPKEQRLQFFILTGGENALEAQGLMRHMLRIFNPVFVDKDGSLDPEDKTKAIDFYHLLNNVSNNFKILVADYVSETQLLEKEKRMPEHGAEYRRAMEAARGVGGDVGPAGAGSSGVSAGAGSSGGSAGAGSSGGGSAGAGSSGGGSAGAGSSGVDKVRVVNLIPRSLKPPTTFAEPDGVALKREERIESELKSLEALDQLVRKGKIVSPSQIEKLIEYGRYKAILGNMGESKAILKEEYEWLKNYRQGLGEAKGQGSSSSK